MNRTNESTYRGYKLWIEKVNRILENKGYPIIKDFRYLEDFLTGITPAKFVKEKIDVS